MTRRPKRVSHDSDEYCWAEETVDEWLHDLRAAVLARDHQHFDVLMARFEGRFRGELIDTLAREMA